jgi:hypothetical protein
MFRILANKAKTRAVRRGPHDPALVPWKPRPRAGAGGRRPIASATRRIRLAGPLGLEAGPVERASRRASGDARDAGTARAGDRGAAGGPAVWCSASGTSRAGTRRRSVTPSI